MAKRKSSSAKGKGSSSKSSGRSKSRSKTQSKSAAKGVAKKVTGAAFLFVISLLVLVGVCIEKGVISADVKLPDMPDITVPQVDSGSGFEKSNADFDFGVYYIDVGQGDCQLIVSGDSAVLIDAGEAEYADKVCDFISSLGIDKLDYVIGTHPHSDHIGGLPKVISDFEVGKILVPKITGDMVPASETYENLLDAVSEKGMKLTAARPGNTYELDGAELEILAPVMDSYDDLNDYSVVCRAVKGDTSFLFTGDASQTSESDMNGSGQELSADVLKVGHHGSRSSSTKKFLERVQPVICVIGVGADNSYGHPTEEVLEKLGEYTDKIYRTDINGTVAIYSDGEQYYVKTEK
ncbi:MAG: MBL fold metallo-hydrolase [Oscillospiraceae bacterium]|nr:MBL fold metallo-hydrolase [Oscillospiraceae bacterium]